MKYAFNVKDLDFNHVNSSINLGEVPAPDYPVEITLILGEYKLKIRQEDPESLPQVSAIEKPDFSDIEVIGALLSYHAKPME